MYNKVQSYNIDMDYPQMSLPKLEMMLFRDNFPATEDFYVSSLELTVEDTFDNQLQIIKNIVSKMFAPISHRLTGLSPETFMIKHPDKILIIVTCGSAKTNHRRYSDEDDSESTSELWTVRKSKITLSIAGNPSTVKEFSSRMRDVTVECKAPVIQWHYMAHGSRESATIFLENKPVVLPEYYPWLEEDPTDYINRFMKSDCGLLILRGEPGTGKTSFIRNLLWKCSSKSMITYEEELFKSDDLFVEFLTGNNNIMIMEDADALLESRVRTGNTSMTKFLNVSDGIINFPNKKLIISANTVDNEKIDEALLRPGRCFDAPIFRRLTFKEVQVATVAANIICPTIERSYSLAEVFSNANGGSASSPKTGRMGFGFATNS
jgi:hypothetical protein